MNYDIQAVIQCLTNLAEGECIPVEHYMNVAKAALQRMTDTLKSVRKAAMLLMESLMLRNPFQKVIDVVQAAKERDGIHKEFEQLVHDKGLSADDNAEAGVMLLSFCQNHFLLRYCAHDA
jgi:hypothetical protein